MLLGLHIGQIGQLATKLRSNRGQTGQIATRPRPDRGQRGPLGTEYIVLREGTQGHLLIGLYREKIGPLATRPI